MSPLRLGATLAAIGALLVTPVARADEPRTEEDDGSPDPSAVVRKWDASVRGGYGSVFTDGLSYLGMGFGGAVGYHPTKRIRLEASVLHSFGSSVLARNEALSYRSAYASTHVTGGVGYDLQLGPVVFRPSIRAGGRFVQGRVRVGSTRSADSHLYPIVGPCFSVLIRVGRVELGFDGEAFFLPTWAAAPSAGLYGVAGIAF